MRLVTLADGRSHLRAPETEDAQILDKIEAAEAIVLDYLKDPHTEWSSPEATPPLVKIAVLVLLAELYRFRGDDEAGQQQTTGDLSPFVTNLLRRLRDPAVA
jgi:hypothetical protein